MQEAGGRGSVTDSLSLLTACCPLPPGAALRNKGIATYLQDLKIPACREVGKMP